MKVQRLIEKYGEKFKLISKDYPYDRALSELWYDIEQLDEPEKKSQSRSSWRKLSSITRNRMLRYTMRSEKRILINNTVSGC